ncbi:post-GPI attachment to proteins factor 3-like protein [Ramicandelaber brevisporus]|nr:post-GPI attachment to proteins factor 3-like protein [Ramicandelaber brevisporus]
MKLGRLLRPSALASLALCLIAMLSLSLVVNASKGDRDEYFQACVQRCDESRCSHPLPFYLRALFWSCRQDCEYECMRAITREAKQNSREIMQYYGKWPFARLWGIQEPASVVFSIMNGFMHWTHLEPLMARVNNPALKWTAMISLLYCVSSLNTWLWSAVFHVRDFPITEKLDYFSAALSILIGFYGALVRVFHIKQHNTRRNLAILFSLCFMAHVSYLSLWKFDYGYNMAACVAVGLLNNAVWIGWSYRQSRRNRAAYAVTHPRTWLPTICVLLLSGAMSLELFDFAPVWDVFDAHSLWHAATIFIIPLWYDFVLMDLDYLRATTHND